MIIEEMFKGEKERELGSVPLLEKIAYGAGVPGINMGMLLVMSFLTMYFTDVAGISAGVVGTIFLVARFTDGIADLIMGVIVDRTNTRWGKTRPWILIGGLGCAITTFLVFNVPSGVSGSLQIAYAFIAYFLLNIFNTVCGIAYSALLPFITDDIKERSTLGSVFFVVQSFLSLILTVWTMPLITKLGGGQQAWTKLTLVYGVASILCLIFSVMKIKERMLVHMKNRKKAEHPPINKVLKSLVQNKYFFMITFAGMTINIFFAVGNAAGLYYAKDVLKNVNAFGIISSASQIPTIIAVISTPFLVSKFGKYKVVMLGCIITIIGCIIAPIGGDNITTLVASSIVKGVGTGFFLACYYPLVAEVAEYGEWKTGIEMEGVAMSSSSIGNKVGNGLGTAMVGWILGFVGYNGLLSIQSPAVLSTLRFMMLYLPIILSACMITFLCLLNLDKIYPQIQKDLRKKRAIEN